MSKKSLSELMSDGWSYRKNSSPADPSTIASAVNDYLEDHPISMDDYVKEEENKDILRYKRWTNDVDANALTTGSIYAGSRSTNVPESYCHITTYGENDDKTQFAIAVNTANMYKRSKNENGWNPWTKVSVCEDLKTINGQSLVGSGNIVVEGGSGVSPLTGKKLYINGDSIAYGAAYTGGYGKCIADAYGMTLINEAVSGATFASGISGRSCIMTSVLSSTELLNADYILLEGGVNDAWNNEAPLGSATSGYNNQTFTDTTTLGALEKTLSYLRATVPSIPVGFIFPHGGMLSASHRWNATDKPAIKKVLEKWGIPYLDISQCAPPIGTYGISSLKSKFATDGTHPNKACYEAYYMPPIANWLVGMFALGSANGTTNISLDTSLSTSGMAADAKTVGDSISSLRQYIDSKTGSENASILWENYTPNATFSKDISIDVDAADYVEAKIDITGCTRNDGEDILSIGKDIATWAAYNIHVYYVKNSNSLLFQGLKGSGSSSNMYSYTHALSNSSNSSNTVTIKILKDHIFVNGVDIYDPNNSKASIMSDLWTYLSELETIQVGSLNTGAISHATYEYIKVVTANSNTETDYDAIANVVISKLTTAESVSV